MQRIMSKITSALQPYNWDIDWHYKNNTMYISELHCGYYPLHYPLIFPFGTDGWQINLEVKSLLAEAYIMMVQIETSILLRAK